MMACCSVQGCATAASAVPLEQALSWLTAVAGHVRLYHQARGEGPWKWRPTPAADRWLAGLLGLKNETYDIVVKRLSPQERRRKRVADQGGAPRVTQRDRVIAMLSEKEVIPAFEFVSAGIHRPTISHMLREGTIARVSFGLYKLTERRDEGK